MRGGHDENWEWAVVGLVSGLIAIAVAVALAAAFFPTFL